MIKTIMIRYSALCVCLPFFAVLAASNSDVSKQQSDPHDVICKQDFDQDGTPLYDHNDRLSAQDAFKRYQVALQTLSKHKVTSDKFKGLADKRASNCMSEMKEDLLRMDHELVNFIRSTDRHTARHIRNQLAEIRDLNRQSPMIKNFWYGSDQDTLPE